MTATATKKKPEKAAIKIPNGLEEIRALYGEPAMPRCREGIVHLPAPVGGGVDMHCHVDVADYFQEFVDALFIEELWKSLKSIEGYAYTSLNGAYPPQPSVAQWGIAIYINHLWNQDHTKPLKDPAGIVPESQQPGIQLYSGDIEAGVAPHPVIVLARKFGFVWGGDRESKPLPAQFALAGGVV